MKQKNHNITGFNLDGNTVIAENSNGVQLISGRKYTFSQIPLLTSLTSNDMKYFSASNVYRTDGTEDWDAETPLVLDCCGKFDAVFSGEPSYDAYFKLAYPWATRVLVDVKRRKVPISATMVRDMTEEEALSWII